MDNKIQKFAEELGYKRAEYVGDYKDSQIYYLIYSDDEICCIGLPRYIVVENGTLRVSEDEETFEIMRSFNDEDEDEEDDEEDEEEDS